MDIVVDWLLNWGFSNPGAQYLPGSSDPVYIDTPQWKTFSVTSFAIVALVVCLSVAACYLPTRRVGQAFVRRWWLFAAVAALASGVGVFLYLFNSPFVWNSQSFGIPVGIAVMRALVATLQALVYFYLLSGASGVVFGRFLGIKGFVDNRQIPIPHLL
ncbi:MAG TPA: hypothetical protein VFS20_22885 [Longimicrobium sp.]|nr:hypothetical protein [Longimicrobium sp.]